MERDEEAHRDVAEVVLELASNDEAASISGSRDRNLRVIERELDTQIIPRGAHLHVRGEPAKVRAVGELVQELVKLARQGHPITPGEVEYAARMVGREGRAPDRAVFPETVLVSDRGKAIRPRTENQRRYVQEIAAKDLTFGIGPAGTGKTYLAVAMAVAALARKDVARIILTRPALEAGERLGFLPGDLQAKIDPYLRPLFDALYDMLEVEKMRRLLERGVVEVAPLAFMRGRTLNDSFIILDEAQNTTREQMKMFLTRLGFGSKAVCTGDITQTDLPPGQVCGLNHVRELLAGIEGIGFVYFTDRDVVRHELVQRIIRAYEAEPVSHPSKGE